MTLGRRELWLAFRMAIVPLLEMSFWLLCEMYTCVFGTSLVYYSLRLQRIYFILKCHVERAGVSAFESSGKHVLSLRKIKSLLEGSSLHEAQLRAPPI